MNRIEALAQALTLAVVTDTDERSQRAVDLAANIASGMQDAQIAQAQVMRCVRSRMTAGLVSSSTDMKMAVR